MLSVLRWNSMKFLMHILTVLCFMGMWTLSLAQSRDEASGLSDSELQQVRERLPCLKPGMGMTEVFVLLGVDLPKKAYGVWGSGPHDDYRRVYQLAPASNEHGYNLIIVHDQERKFKRASIACWTQPNKCAEDNEKAKNNPEECPNEAKQ
jgi:hypothetical protein